MNIRKNTPLTRSRAATRLLLNSSIIAAASFGTALRADETVELPLEPQAVATSDAATVISTLPPAPTPEPAYTPPVFDPREFKPQIPAARPVASKSPAPAAKIVKPAARAAIKTEPNIWQIAKDRKLALPLSQGRIIVWKSQRRLELWNGDALVKSFPVALGSQPLGHKQKQGDGKTPEGEFFICTRNATSSAFHVFLGLSYPALPDAKRAVNNKSITWQEYRVIQQRLASRSAPLWRTRLGGWVGIHGGSGGKFAARKSKERGAKDWTAGCIALTDRQIEEIYAATRLGTPVSVRP